MNKTQQLARQYAQALRGEPAASGAEQLYDLAVPQYDGVGHSVFRGVRLEDVLPVIASHFGQGHTVWLRRIGEQGWQPSDARGGRREGAPTQPAAASPAAPDPAVDWYPD